MLYFHHFKQPIFFINIEIEITEHVFPENFPN